MKEHELRALADALEPMAIAPRFKGFDVPGFCAWLRACADAQPVGYVTANGLRSLRQDDATVLLYAHDYLIRPDHVALYTHPAPAAPQAEPMADSDADYWLRNRQPILDAIERAGFMLMSNASGFWLHPRGKTDAQAEPLSDERITKGEYVLATKFSDGDPGDHWGVGFYDRLENGRHYIVDRAGQQIRGGGFRRAGRITMEVGIWLLSAAKSLEASPPGTVNLWTMLTERAHGIGGSDDH